MLSLKANDLHLHIRVIDTSSDGTHALSGLCLYAHTGMAPGWCMHAGTASTIAHSDAASPVVRSKDGQGTVRGSQERGYPSNSKAMSRAKPD